MSQTMRRLIPPYVSLPKNAPRRTQSLASFLLVRPVKFYVGLFRLMSVFQRTHQGELSLLSRFYRCGYSIRDFGNESGSASPLYKERLPTVLSVRAGDDGDSE